MTFTFGATKPGDLFHTFKQRGDQSLIDLRSESVGDNSTRQPRTWRLKESAELIGCAVKDLTSLGVRELTLDQINTIRDQLGLRYRRPDGSDPMVMSIVNFKGGVGKTTTCIHLAQRAAIEGLRVLVVDLDPQATTTMNAGNIIPDLELGDDDLIGEALVNNPDDLKYIIRDTYFPGVDLLPSNLALQDADLALPNASLNNAEILGSAATRLTKGLSIVRQDYDLILIDCSPNMGALTSNAIVASNGLLIPIPPYSFDSASFVMLNGALANLFESTGLSLEYLRILITKHPKTKTANLQERALRDLYSPYVMSSVLFETTMIEKVTRSVSSIYDKAPDDQDRRTYLRAREIMDAVTGEIIDDLKTIWSTPKGEGVEHE